MLIRKDIKSSNLLTKQCKNIPAAVDYFNKTVIELFMEIDR